MLKTTKTRKITKKPWGGALEDLRALIVRREAPNPRGPAGNPSGASFVLRIIYLQVMGFGES